MSNVSHIDRRRLLTLLGAAGGATLLVGASGARAMNNPVRKPKVVVELFTSQGCNACPPADALLGRLVRQPDILGIGYNIDYWDYLGWRDTLARAEFTRRQRMYAKARGDDAVYTPQIIVNGRWHVVGNNPRKVAALINKARGKGGCQLTDMTMRREDKALVVELAEASGKVRAMMRTFGGKKGGKGKAEATLWVVGMKSRVPVRIASGENRGRHIAYHHVARHIMPAAMWHGEEKRLSLPLDEIMRGGADFCAALLQLGTHGPIIAAARI